MNHGVPRRARVSRETRLLLVTALLSVGVLWILARIRFPDQPASPNPVQPILTQLAARPRYEELAGQIAQLRPRLDPLLAGSMLRIRNDVGLTWLGPAPAAAGERRDVLRADPASGLAVVSVPFLPAPPPVPWNPGDLQQPRYLVAAEAPAGTVSLRPVFVGSLVPVESPLWPGLIWTVPPAVGLTPGRFVFTTDGLLAGLVVEHGSRTAIVPGAVLLAEANRLQAPSTGIPGTLGLDVQALTPAIARATGAGAGVVVTRVDPGGPAAAGVEVGDVLEAAAGAPLPTPLHWTARAARVNAGDQLAVRVRRGTQIREVVLVAAPRSDPAGQQLGLGMRNVAATGSVVTDVQRGSAADRAGLRPGDVITLAGTAKAPTPAAIRRAFEGAPDGGAVLIAYDRSGAHAVTALEK